MDIDQSLAEIRQRWETAISLAESLPPVIDDWENGSGFLDGIEYLFSEVRMTKHVGEVTFVLHAHEDMGILLGIIEQLREKLGE